MRVGIVGGGITGLALAHALACRGRDFVLFEKSGHWGGAIRTEFTNGRVAEFGPQRMRLTASVRRLVHDLGLGSQVVAAAPKAETFILSKEGIRPFSDLIPMLNRRPDPPESPETRLGAWLRHTCGDAAYRGLVGPVVAATFASDPDEMLRRPVLPLVEEMLAGLIARGSAPPAFTFRDGLSVLPGALAARYREFLRPGTAVGAIRRADDCLEIQAGEGPGEVVDRVVLTGSGPDMAPLLAEVAPAAAARLARLRYNTIRIVALDTEGCPPGFGYRTALDMPLRTQGVTWNASVFAGDGDTGREGICTAFLGGLTDTDVASWPDERVGRVAAREFEQVHGFGAEPLAVASASLPAWDTSWAAIEGGLELPENVTLASTCAERLAISSRIARAGTLARDLSARSDAES